MNQRAYLEAFKKECEAQAALSVAKGKDYAGEENVFTNFELVGWLTGGRITAEEGILVRMSDKLQRAANLIRTGSGATDESITDTLRDLSIYAKILKIYIESKGTEVRSRARAVAGFIPPGTSTRSTFEVPAERKPTIRDRFYCNLCRRSEPFVASEFRTMFGDRDWVIDTEGGMHLVSNCWRAE